jgi:transcriptional regulator with XRE-family HTH domain
MRLRNEIFARVLDWLIQNNKVEDQKDLALKTGISQNTVSRIMTGKVEPSDDTLRKLNATFGNIFNMHYLRGESIVMLIEDVAYYKSHPGELNKMINGECDDKIDQSSLVNAALAAKDTTIAAKDETIAALREQIQAKDELIAALRQQIELLQQQVHAAKDEELFKDFPFPKGIADKKDKPSTHV